jgi:hypothetical protein
MLMTVLTGVCVDFVSHDTLKKFVASFSVRLKPKANRSQTLPPPTPPHRKTTNGAASDAATHNMFTNRGPTVCLSVRWCPLCSFLDMTCWFSAAFRREHQTTTYFRQKQGRQMRF